MKTIVIPVDHSAASENAIKYGTAFGAVTENERIILLQSLYVPIYVQCVPSVDYVQVSDKIMTEDRTSLEAELQLVAQRLRTKVKAGVIVETITSEEPLARALNQLSNEQQPDLIIAGVCCETDDDESFVESQVIHIAKISTVPMLIVPSNVSYQLIENALVPCDFSTVSSVNLLKNLRHTYLWLHPKLLVLNVAPGEKHMQDAHEDMLEDILSKYQYDVYYSSNKNVLKGILQFQEQNEVQMIIALPGKHSFFYSLTHKSISEAITLNANLPVLVLK
ncbi:universal stress protein [Arcticibacter eurypsychrophilus]|uniref:universal stress protein n=1 Tax=Arcticibacter eurypsychrophilus TaxID=1434752 RepID=UPI00084D4048|nr:universal stress protein [Arcticibacter eurypsychrophilus]